MRALYSLRNQLILLFLLWLHISVAFALPSLGTGRMINGAGQFSTTTTTFTGGAALNGVNHQANVTVNSDAVVNLQGSIQVSPSDVGKQADLLVVIGVEPNEPFDGGVDTVYYTLDGVGNFSVIDLYSPPSVWMGQLAVNPFKEGVNLTSGVPVNIGELDSNKRGSMNYAFIGYRLSDNSVIYAATPVVISTTNFIPIIWGTHPVLESGLTTTSQPLGVFSRGIRWPNGKTLKVSLNFQGENFIATEVCRTASSESDCRTRITNEIINAASSWSKHGNIRFQYESVWSEGDIRARLIRGTAGYSYVGTYSSLRPKTENTMELGVDYGLRETTIHEFGHAIGFQHEHISPKVSYSWNKEQVYSDMAQRGWNREMVDFNIFNQLKNSGELFVTEYDPLSIMIYGIPAHWVSATDKANKTLCPSNDPYYCVAPPTELSQMDKWTVAQMYPFSTTDESTSKEKVSLEDGITRRGSDYTSFIPNRSDPELCRTACQNDQKCKAFDYVKPSAVWTNSPPACWLKESVPPIEYNPCCMSGVKTSTGSIGSTVTSVDGVTRYGTSFNSFLPERKDPELCRIACQNDVRCKAFSYVKEGAVYPNSPHACWLLDSVSSVVSDPRCVSGEKM